MIVFFCIAAFIAAIVSLLIWSAIRRIRDLTSAEQMQFTLCINFLLIAGSALLYTCLAPAHLSSQLQ